jgi:hypothetical protein
VVPKPGDGETLRSKPIIAPDVATIVGMSRAVAFDDEAMLEANEIDDIGADWNLATPFRRLQPPILQETP